MGRDSGQATDAFKLLKMFVKGKGPFEFERPHHGEACAVGKTGILVSVSFKKTSLNPYGQLRLFFLCRDLGYQTIWPFEK